MNLRQYQMELFNSEHHRCKTNLEASYLQLKVAQDQLERIKERVADAEERMDHITRFLEIMNGPPTAMKPIENTTYDETDALLASQGRDPYRK